MEHQKNNNISLFTIGHSTRSIDEFLELLRLNGIQHLVDIRTIPRSRRNPQYNGDALAARLRTAGIAYTHLKALGGLRHPRKDSVNLAWRNTSFRGYADYMQMPEFEDAILQVIRLAKEKPTALMCAEAVPWRCHRSLVADALIVRAIEVREIIGSAPPQLHRLTEFAHVCGTRVTYPQEGSGAQMPLLGSPQQ